jgi:hypothetical protein
MDAIPIPKELLQWICRPFISLESLSDLAICHQPTRVRTMHGVAGSRSMAEGHVEALLLDCSSGMNSC